MIFYDLSGGMESAAMLVLEIERIRATSACVRFADTGKHFPEMYESLRQIERVLGVNIVTVPRRIDFDTYLFERGGMIRKGTNDCSRKMKRSNLSRHMRTFPRPREVNIGFNRDEDARADAFSERNERDWLHWRYPLIERNISRPQTVAICEKAGFTILCEMYAKMGRFDCFTAKMMHQLVADAGAVPVQQVSWRTPTRGRGGLAFHDAGQRPSRSSFSRAAAFIHSVKSIACASHDWSMRFASILRIRAHL